MINQYRFDPGTFSIGCDPFGADGPTGDAALEHRFHSLSFFAEGNAVLIYRYEVRRTGNAGRHGYCGGHDG